MAKKYGVILDIHKESKKELDNYCGRCIISFRMKKGDSDLESWQGPVKQTKKSVNLHCVQTVIPPDW